jgi:hypothetical protein
MGVLVKKVVFMLPYPPPLDFRRKFFVQQLLQEGFETEYWDLGAVLGYDMKFTYDLKADGLVYVKIAGLKDLSEMLERSSTSGTVFVMQITRALASFPIYFLLTRFKKKTVTLARGYLPSVSRSERTVHYYLRGVRNAVQIKRWVSRAIYLVLNKLFPIKYYDVAFTAGRVAEKLNAPHSLRLLPVHHPDVDVALEKSPCVIDLPINYCVFVDDYLPHHPDFGIEGGDTLDPVAYYASLNTFFDKIEAQLKTKVVIAAHPKACYEPSPFKGRFVGVNDTEVLVRNADLVLAHASTAISFAVFHKKTIILMTSGAIERTHPAIHAQMLKTAEILGCPILDFEKIESILNVGTKPNIEKYEFYNAEYLSNATNLNCSFQVIAAEFNSLTHF